VVVPQAVVVVQGRQDKVMQAVLVTVPTALRDRVQAAAAKALLDKILLIIIWVVPAELEKFGQQAELLTTPAAVEDPHTQDQAALGD
jgi:hypothetical protein